MIEIDYIEIIGMCAAVLTTAAYLPQVYKTYKTKDVSGLSLPMVLMLLVGVILWFIYGLILKRPSLILANGITLVSAVLLVSFILKYRK
ncbi:SemiSWEET family sugar transporter [Winogradskyella poriferorum]|uniref:SemiSWEET family sugar transporter n=1 Tax=Winogradskyella poriferorum TaxID=307627 RepID=UPI003D65593B